jgi:PhnB protein
MPSKPSPVPEGFHTATPYLMVRDVTSALEFYKKAFGATELLRMTDGEGRITQAEFKVGTSPVMMGWNPNVVVPDPSMENLPYVSVYLYVEDVDALAAQAVAAGAKVLYPIQDQFYGNRDGGIVDPFGVVWWIATRIEAVSQEELNRRAAARRESQQQAS